MRLFERIHSGGREVMLKRAMDKLVREHPTPDSVETWFLYITNYVQGLNERENEFCKVYLRNRANQGFAHHYDDMR